MAVELVELELCVMYTIDSSSKESSIQLQCIYNLPKLPFATQNDQIQCVLFYANIVHLDVTLIQEDWYHMLVIYINYHTQR